MCVFVCVLCDVKIDCYKPLKAALDLSANRQARTAVQTEGREMCVRCKHCFYNTTSPRINTALTAAAAVVAVYQLPLSNSLRNELYDVVMRHNKLRK